STPGGARKPRRSNRRSATRSCPATARRKSAARSGRAKPATTLWRAYRHPMQIKTVGVLGCGLMGSGIAQVCAASGYKTIVREVTDQLLHNGLGRIKKFLDDGVAKGKVAGDARDKTLTNL